MRNDHGGVIVGYFTKITLVFAIFSVVCFDAVSVGVARFKVEDTAKGTAAVAAERWNESRNAKLAYHAAVNYAEDSGVTVDAKSFTIAPDGRVTLTVRKEAATLLLFRSKRTEGWTVATAEGTAKAL